MGMFDYVNCEHALPDGWSGPGTREFQTKDTDGQWMETYVIRQDGTLWLDGEQVMFHGALEFYTCNISASGQGCFATSGDEPPYEANYTALYDRGNLIRIDGAHNLLPIDGWMKRDSLFAKWRRDDAKKAAP